MAYCTQTDILTQLSELDLAQLTSENDSIIDSMVVDAAIADADAEIDGYVAARYSVPLSPVPPIIKKYSKTIAMYNLHSRRASRLGGIADAVKADYENAIDFLKNVAKGLVKLGVDPPPVAPQTGGSKFEANPDVDNRDFTKDKLTGF